MRTWVSPESLSAGWCSPSRPTGLAPWWKSGTSQRCPPVLPCGRRRRPAGLSRLLPPPALWPGCCPLYPLHTEHEAVKMFPGTVEPGGRRIKSRITEVNYKNVSVPPFKNVFCLSLLYRHVDHCGDWCMCRVWHHLYLNFWNEQYLHIHNFGFFLWQQNV